MPISPGENENVLRNGAHHATRGVSSISAAMTLLIAPRLSMLRLTVMTRSSVTGGFCIGKVSGAMLVGYGSERPEYDFRCETDVLSDAVTIADVVRLMIRIKKTMKAVKGEKNVRGLQGT